MGSGEDKKVKIFKDGKILQQIDALDRNADKNVNPFVKILESFGAGSLATFGITATVPAQLLTGFSPATGVIIFGSSYFIVRYNNVILNLFKNGK